MSQDKIIKELNEKYGTDGWDGVKYGNKIFAIKEPSEADYTTYKSFNEKLMYDTMANKVSNKTATGQQKILLQNCLITDVEGLGAPADFAKLLSAKPGVVEKLLIKLQDLMSSGIEDIQKKGSLAE